MSAMPRNVVTLAPRVLALPTRRNREARRAVESWVVERYRARIETDPTRIEIDFAKNKGGRAVKNEVTEGLDRVDPRWRRVLVLDPTEDALRQKGE